MRCQFVVFRALAKAWEVWITTANSPIVSGLAVQLLVAYGLKIEKGRNTLRLYNPSTSKSSVYRKGLKDGEYHSKSSLSEFHVALLAVRDALPEARMPGSMDSPLCGHCLLCNASSNKKALLAGVVDVWAKLLLFPRSLQDVTLKLHCKMFKHLRPGAALSRSVKFMCTMRTSEAALTRKLFVLKKAHVSGPLNVIVAADATLCEAQALRKDLHLIAKQKAYSKPLAE